MKINNINSIQGINKYQKINQNEQDIKKKEMKKDQVSISNEAEAMLNQTKDISKNDKITEIKSQIENGTYHVDSKLVAEKILDFYKK